MEDKQETEGKKEIKLTNPNNRIIFTWKQQTYDAFKNSEPLK